MQSSLIICLLSCLVACNAVTQPSAELADFDKVISYDQPQKSTDESANKSTPPPLTPTIMEIIDPTLSWYEQAELLADRDYLPKAFKRFNYSPPKRTFLVAGEVVKGAGQPGFRYFSLNDTAFTHSEGNFWPASTVKLLAAIGALHTLNKFGLTGAARLDFVDDRGHFKGTASTLYGSALTMSNNKAYDWLVKIAGFQEINVELFSAKRGFPNIKLQRSYDPAAISNFRTSPEIKYKERDLEGLIPARESKIEFENCPEESNCLTLFELLDALRRVVLHKELPDQDKFNLNITDIRGLLRALGKSKCRVAQGAENGLGHPIECFNKSGWYPKADQNDHAFIVDTITKRRYLISQSIPHHEKEATAAEMTELSEHTLRAIARGKPNGPVLQRNGGLPINVSLKSKELRQGVVNLTVTVEGNTDKVELWHNRELLRETHNAALDIDLPSPFDQTLFVLQAWRGKKLVGYKIFSIAENTSATKE